MLLWMLACAPAPAPAPYVVPAGATASLHDPDVDVAVWPDQSHAAPDPTTATGFTVPLRPGARARLEQDLTPELLLLEALDELDGFGTNGAAYFRFSGPVDLASAAAAVSGWRLSTGAPVPFDLSTTDEGATLMIQPRGPLVPNERYAWVITDALRAADGSQVWASPWTRAALVAHAQPAQDADMQAALRLAGVEAERVVDLTVFHTQSLHARDLEGAEVLAAHTPTWTPGPCVVEGALERCELTLEVADLLGPDDRITPAEPLGIQQTYALPVTVWLPVTRDAPLQVIVHGHGLSGDRYEARGTAEQLGDLGFAVVAVDAPKHGDHPTTTTTADLLWVLEMFGISAVTGTFDPRVLRDQFRRAAWDKIQLVRALSAPTDLTGDGAPDVDGGFIAWTGHSLGGLLGPQLLAMSPELAGGVLSVPGGRMADIVRYGSVFAPLIVLMAPPGTSTGTIDRFFPLLQATIEAGDPASWAPVLREQGRDLFVTMVKDDDIIPNPTTAFLATALDVWLAGPEIIPIPGLTRYTDPLPATGNHDGHTSILWQYDVAHEGGVEVDATHGHIFDADEHIMQTRAFLDSLRRDGRGVVPDPGAR
jgi:dienelactone hydrolase